MWGLKAQGVRCQGNYLNINSIMFVFVRINFLSSYGSRDQANLLSEEHLVTNIEK